MGFANEMTDGDIEVVGRPTPEASHEAAHMQLEFAQLASAVMYP